MKSRLAEQGTGLYGTKMDQILNGKKLYGCGDIRARKSSGSKSLESDIAQGMCCCGIDDAGSEFASSEPGLLLEMSMSLDEFHPLLDE